MENDKPKQDSTEKQKSKLKDLQNYVFDPSQGLYYKWLIIISITVLYNYLFIIGRASFELLQKYNPILWCILDYVCDFIYLIDIFVRMRTGYLVQGILLKDCKKLTIEYIKSFQFKLDMISILPLELASIYLVDYRTQFRFNRLIRVNRLFECRLKIETRASFPFVFRIIYLVLLIIVIIHWNACFYFLISKLIGIGADGWVFIDLKHNSGLAFQYVSCFFWSTLMLTTIGEVKSPETTIESIVMIVNFLVAIVLVATLVGNIGSVISNMTIEQDKFQQKVDAIKSLMKLRKVSSELEKRVIKWFDYLHKNNQILDENEILSNLPEKLRIEIASYVHLDTLKKVNIFSDCEEGFLKELVTKLKVQVYSPGDYVCRKGDIGKEMYIIKRGSLNVVSDDGKTVFVTLKAGSSFGELSILNIPGNKIGNRRTANVQSVGYSDLITLTKNDLWNVLVDYTANKKMIIDKGYEKLLKDNLLDDEYMKKYNAKLARIAANQSEDLDEEGEFIESTPEHKLIKLESIYDNLEKQLESLTSELDANCSTVKSKIESIKELYHRKIGITV